MSTWGHLLSFSLPGGGEQKKLQGCGLLLGGVSTQADTKSNTPKPTGDHLVLSVRSN